ncbi:hypothetical protein EMPS_09141 [Entomortierella parvispora]|uniref:Uncharacterized protein n=1 Tax=Entomortierella parvispora TaxID=205924 RepID=A0A9P3HHM5_9FUNG|nr:hypothetical protein EMPS_09141 [Entomortierella parvispora]
MDVTTTQFSKPTGSLSRSISTRTFSSQPVAPLNIASRPQFLPLTFGPRKTDSPLFLHPLSAFASTPSSPFSYQPLVSSSQTSLEANVRHLCDLVDSAFTDVMKDTLDKDVPEHVQDWRSSAGTLCIQIPSVAASESVSDLGTVLSPRTLDQAKFDISKVKEEIVSTMNSDFLLSLFPSPPNTRPSPSSSSITVVSSSSSPVQSISPLEHSFITSTESTASTPSTAMTSKEPSASAVTAEAIAPEDIQKQEQSAKRNWAIPPGLALFQHHITTDNSSDSPPSPCSSERSSSLPAHRGSPSSSLPSPTCSSVNSALSSPISPHALSSMEGLSQRLWAIETQMRRPSFLVNRRTSILSTLFASNAISPLMIGGGPDSAMDRSPSTLHSPLGTTRTEKEPYTSTSMPILPLQWNLERLEIAKDQCSPASSPSSPCSEKAFHPIPQANHEEGRSPTGIASPTTPTTAVDSDVDWRAWHANWTRRRPGKGSKLQKEHQQFLRQQQQQHEAADSLLSPRSPMSPGAFSLTSTLCSPTFPPTFSGHSTLCSRAGNFETTATQKFWQSATAAAAVNLKSGHQSHTANSILQRGSSLLRKYQSSPTQFTPESNRHPHHPHHGGKSKLAIKDANPELWEDVDGQKWKDRFQSLVHNFQSSAGKHSRRLAEILPKAKSRWVNKRSLNSPSSAAHSSPHSSTPLHSQPTPSSAKVW